MAKSEQELVTAIADIPVKAGGKRIPTGEPFEIDRAALEQMAYAREYRDQNPKDGDQLTAKDRADLVAAAVAEAIEKDPDRETQPTVATVSGITGFKVAAVEITPAYEAALAAAKEDGQQGTGNEAGSGENSGN